MRLGARWCPACGKVLYARLCDHGTMPRMNVGTVIRRVAPLPEIDPPPRDTVPLPDWHPCHPFLMPLKRRDRTAPWTAPAPAQAA